MLQPCASWRRAELTNGARDCISGRLAGRWIKSCRGADHRRVAARLQVPLGLIACVTSLQRIASSRGNGPTGQSPTPTSDITSRGPKYISSGRSGRTACSEDRRGILSPPSHTAVDRSRSDINRFANLNCKLAPVVVWRHRSNSKARPQSRSGWQFVLQIIIKCVTVWHNSMLSRVMHAAAKKLIFAWSQILSNNTEKLTSFTTWIRPIDQYYRWLTREIYSIILWSHLGVSAELNLSKCETSVY